MKSDSTRTAARVILVLSVIAIAAGYASAILPGDTPAWGAWAAAIGIPASLCSIMMLGAVRGKSGIGSLKLPLLFVFVVLAGGFLLALALPPGEGANARLYLGLPLRAAIIIYGIGLLPIVVLPVAYAITFKSQTLSEEDIEAVREAARRRRQES